MSSSNGFRKLMLELSAEMLQAHPLTGIGGDNFGTEVNKYRILHSEKYPADPYLAYGENEIPETGT